MPFREPMPESLGAIAKGRSASLEPMRLDTARALSLILAGMEPWSRIGSKPEGLCQTMLTDPAGQARSWCMRVDGEPAGVLVIHEDWLVGPYLKRIAVLPKYQGRGLARASLAWWEADARQAGAANLWLCVSSFNLSAQKVYEAAGFCQCGLFKDLVVLGYDEILMRKQLKPARPAPAAS